MNPQKQNQLLSCFLIVACSLHVAGYCIAEDFANNPVSEDVLLSQGVAQGLEEDQPLSSNEDFDNAPIDESGEGSYEEQTSAILDVLDLKAMDVRDVFKLISQKSGINIVAGQGVKGKITIYLKDVEVKEALRIIVEANGWALVEDEKVLKVMLPKDVPFQTEVFDLKYATAAAISEKISGSLTPDLGAIKFDERSNRIMISDTALKIEEIRQIIKAFDQKDQEVLMEVFHLKYATAATISEKVSESLTPGLGVIRFDERSNKIVVSDTALNIEEIGQIIKAFDQKDQEVLIEAKILQIILSDQHKLGINWEAVVSDYHGLDLKNTFDILSDGEKRGELSIGTLATDGYTALIQALKTVGETEILSSPRIAVVNNKEAKILVGSTEPYVTNTTTTPASGPTTIAESVNFIEVGVKLYVTPTIHGDGFITMKIKPEVSSVISTLTTSNNNTIPIVETSEAETTVIVKDGVTIVIGGLIKEEKIKTTKRIPFLGSIPILGYAFRSVDNLDKKTEIVIFLTPRIITGDRVSAEQVSLAK